MEHRPPLPRILAAALLLQPYGGLLGPVSNHLACTQPLSPPCSKPSVVANAVDAVSGQAVVTPPLAGHPWDSFSLRVCVSGTADCRTLTGCKAAATAGATSTCLISGCTAEKSYSVWATAVHADGSKSTESDPTGFTTPKHRQVIAPCCPLAAAKLGKKVGSKEQWGHTQVLCHAIPAS